MDLSSHHFILTGATGGLGSALAHTLTKVGSRLTLVGRNETRLQELSQQLGQPYLPMDINDSHDQILLLDYVLQQPTDRPVTGLINNAGVTAFGLLHELAPEQLQDVVATNLLAPLQLTRLLLPQIGRAPNSMIINIGSTFGDIGYPANTAYCASKFGLRGFSEALRRELCDTEIDVVYIAPRAMSTTMNRGRAERVNSAMGVAEDHPLWVAEEIVRSIQQGKYDIHIGWPEKLYSKINRLIPALVDKALRKHLRVIKQEIRYD